MKRPGSSTRSWPGCREPAGRPWCSASWKAAPRKRSHNSALLGSNPPPPVGSRRHLLRLRLIRRGLAPTAGLVAAALGPEPASAAIPQITVDTTARAAIRFAAGQATAGIVPASATALAEGVITAMFWTKLKAIAIVRLRSHRARHRRRSRGPASVCKRCAQDRERLAESKSRVKRSEPMPICGPRRNNTGHWCKATTSPWRHMTSSAKTRRRRRKERPPTRGITFPRRNSTRNSSRWPSATRKIPSPIDALVWIIEKTMRYWDGYNRARGDAIGRTMEILARDHLANPRLGAVCLKLTYYPSPRRDEFLRAVA